MSQEVIRIKKRISSVSGALKVTSAMKLVSTVKLKKWKNKMLSNREYSEQLKETTDLVLSFAKKAKTPFNIINENTDKNLYIVVSSTLGLCGSYNNNIFKLADVQLKEKDDAIILGNKGLIHYENGSFTKILGFSEYNSIENTSLINSLTSFLTSEYLKGKYHEIHLIYSEYKNSLVFLPKDVVILPLKRVDTELDSFGPILEPDEKTLVEKLVPIYIKTIVYSKLLESEVCEQAARCNAMDNATNNAKDLLDDLRIEFNKARQGAITQEITEIVSAANAL
jgi:F-type H+-transporting ATPase subunit gamma